MSLEKLYKIYQFLNFDKDERLQLIMNVRRILLEGAHKSIGKLTRYNAWQQFQFLSQSQWWPVERLEEYRWGKFKRTISHAYTNIPFYQELWKKHGICPDDIKEPSDIHHLPIISRDGIDREKCLARKDVYKKGMSIVTTSGSTGEPFSVYIDLPAYQKKYALWLREFSFADYTFDKKVASFWHRSYRGYKREEPHTLIRDVVWGILLKKKIFPPLPTNCNTTMNLKQGLLFHEQLMRFQPFLMESLYHFILTLANFILDNNLSPIPITKMFMHGVPSRKERKKVEEVFPGVEIFNRYSSHEFEGIACECSAHAGMHISADSYFVEFIKEDNTAASPGEIARIIITDLDNRAMPLIRYEIRDMGWYLDKTCPCGRGLPLMSGLAGRKDEYVISADNKKFYFSFFHEYFDRYHEVRFSQIYQNGNGCIEVQIVKEHVVEEDILSGKITKELNDYLGTGVTTKYVDAISEEKNGKILSIKRID